MDSYKPYERIQREVIGAEPNLFRQVEFKNEILLTDSVRGVYIPKKNIIIDLRKIKEIEEEFSIISPDTNFKTKKASLNPESILKNSEIGVEMERHYEHIKFVTKTGKYAWINSYKRKIFGTKVRFYVQDKDLPLLVTNGRKKAVGIILPAMKVKEED